MTHLSAGVSHLREALAIALLAGNRIDLAIAAADSAFEHDVIAGGTAGLGATARAG